MRAGWNSNLARWRGVAGLSQVELSRRAGVSRQALAAIEGGRQVPSTRLALRLACLLGVTVERLFASDEASVLHGVRWPCGVAPSPDQRMMVGQVDGRWVAHPLTPNQLNAADGLVDGEDPGAVRLLGTGPIEPPVLVAGCAPLLGVLTQRSVSAGVPIRWVPANTSRALQLLDEGLVHVAGVHGPEADLSRVSRRQVGALRVRFTTWHQGLLVPCGNPLGIADAADLALRGLRYSRRERGASVRRTTDQLMTAAGAVPPPGPEATSHEEVAAQVRWGAADGGVAIESVALQAGLGFLPILEEPFDLMIPEHHAALPSVAALLNVLGGAAFRREAGSILGYDCSRAGDVIDAVA